MFICLHFVISMHTCEDYASTCTVAHLVRGERYIWDSPLDGRVDDLADAIRYL